MFLLWQSALGGIVAITPANPPGSSSANSRIPRFLNKAAEVIELESMGASISSLELKGSHDTAPADHWKPALI